MSVKTEQLGINYSTAQNRLRKQILFKYVKLAGHDICSICNEKIEDVLELSVEHNIPWQNEVNSKELFWDLDNISFAHLKCNSSKTRKVTGITHPSKESYRRGCRCEDCKEIQKLRMQEYRAK